MKLTHYKIVRIYSRLMNIHGEPRPVALGYALGTFLAATPLMGVHCILAVFIAGVLKWNRLSAGIGALTSNLLTAPMLYGGTYYIGSKTLGMKEIFVIPGNLNDLLSQSSDMLIALTVGGFIAGIPLAICSYYICYHIIKRYLYYKNPKNRQPCNPILNIP